MPEWLAQVVAMAAGAAGVYAAIRADLSYLRATAEGAKISADRAHRRIDDYFDRRGQHEKA